MKGIWPVKMGEHKSTNIYIYNFNHSKVVTSNFEKLTGQQKGPCCYHRSGFRLLNTSNTSTNHIRQTAGCYSSIAFTLHEGLGRFGFFNFSSIWFSFQSQVLKYSCFGFFGFSICTSEQCRSTYCENTKMESIYFNVNSSTLGVVG